MDSIEYLRIAYEMLGIPHKTLGRDRQGGDCLYIIIEFYARLGFTVPDPYSANAEEVLASEFYKAWHRIEEPELPCAVHCVANDDPTHLGIWLGPREILHTSYRTGAIITRPTYLTIKGFYQLNDFRPPHK